MNYDELKRRIESTREQTKRLRSEWWTQSPTLPPELGIVFPPDPDWRFHDGYARDLDVKEEQARINDDPWANSPSLVVRNEESQTTTFRDPWSGNYMVLTDEHVRRAIEDPMGLGARFPLYVRDALNLPVQGPKGPSAAKSPSKVYRTF